MVTIGRIPRCLCSFFRPQRRHFSKQAWPHFWGFVMAIAMGAEHTIDRLNALLRGRGWLGGRLSAAKFELNRVGAHDFKADRAVKWPRRHRVPRPFLQ